MFQPVNPKVSFPEIEHKILTFWEKEKIFKKSLEKTRKGRKYVFFDGPPFANGLPHYGHILANAIKDAMTRYFTMQGYFVPRRNGWDCHGLPVEYEIEKELNMSGRKEIEKYGVAAFNKKCRESVFRYTTEWETLLKRIARWVDFEDSYATLDNNYIESIWWVFKKIWDEGLIYEGYKSMHVCPRCATPLSNFEVGLGYKDVTDLAVFVQFELTEEQNTYVLAWTTTPWTLPGNAALAIGHDIEYVKATLHGKRYILAKTLVSKIFTEKPEKVEKVSVKSLLGKKYKPLFDYFVGSSLSNIQNAWKIIQTDFVKTDEGTGIVHIAPGFGEDDFSAGKENNLPIISHVGIDGVFTKEITDFAGKFVKGQEHNLAEYLQKKGLLFKKENIRHSYPHCWRCDTPLLNYTTNAWFIAVTKLKQKLLKNNLKIHWQPEHIKQGRFGKWLENVRDWNISRNRYWGAPIPIWECSSGHKKCLSSINDLSENHPQGIRLLLMRHGEYIGNTEHFCNSNPAKKFPLTEKGKRQCERVGKTLVNEKIDLIYASPMFRAQQTAHIISKILGKRIITDKYITERQWGSEEGTSWKEFSSKFSSAEEMFLSRKFKHESMIDVKKRVKKFIDGLSKKYQGKTILVISHGDAILAMEAATGRLSDKQLAIKSLRDDIPLNAEIKELWLGNEPLNEEDELDLHKPYIDKIKVSCTECGKKMKRVTEVLDCWFESGSMPYAQLHYPFENKKDFELNFPADFIGEGLDQTRGWFYTLHVLASILFNSPAFKNVIVNGILLAADGEKLSKRKKNYPDPHVLFETKGVDSTRFFLYTSTAPLAEDVRFSEAHVDEMVKKFTLTLWNTYSFFVTYANIDKWKPKKKRTARKAKHKLDQWILSELNLLIQEVTEEMNNYNVTKATRPMLEFVDNLSNWYIRRSRRRFWKSQNDRDKYEAYETLHTVLVTLSTLLAPFMPFLSDEMYKNLTGNPSVHLSDWPEMDKRRIDNNLRAEIKLARKIVTLGHAVRAKKGIKVRQPLSLIHIGLPGKTKSALIKDQISVILEELNIKELKIIKNIHDHLTQIARVNAKVLGPKYGAETQKIIQKAREGRFEIKSDGRVQIGKWLLESNEIEIGYQGKAGFDVASEEGIVVIVTTEITPQLKQEGYSREIVRHIQELRREAAYQVSDRIYACIEGSGELEQAITNFADYIKQETLSIELQQSGDFEWDKEKIVEFEGQKVKIAIRKES